MERAGAMSLTDKKVRALCKDLRAQIRESPKNIAPIGYQRMLAGLVELLQHRVIAREILKFERDPVAESFDGIVRMVHQVHDKKVTPAPKRKQGRSKEMGLDWSQSSTAKAFRKALCDTVTQVEERRRG